MTKKLLSQKRKNKRRKVKNTKKIHHGGDFKDFIRKIEREKERKNIKKIRPLFVGSFEEGSKPFVLELGYNKDGSYIDPTLGKFYDDDNFDGVVISDGQRDLKCGLNSINNILQFKNPDCLVTATRCKLSSVSKLSQAQQQGNSFATDELVNLINGEEDYDKTLKLKYGVHAELVDDISEEGFNSYLNGGNKHIYQMKGGSLLSQVIAQTALKKTKTGQQLKEYLARKGEDLRDWAKPIVTERLQREKMESVAGFSQYPYSVEEYGTPVEGNTREEVEKNFIGFIERVPDYGGHFIAWLFEGGEEGYCYIIDSMGTITKIGKELAIKNLADRAKEIEDYQHIAIYQSEFGKNNCEAFSEYLNITSGNGVNNTTNSVGLELFRVDAEIKEALGEDVYTGEREWAYLFSNLKKMNPEPSRYNKIKGYLGNYLPRLQKTQENRVKVYDPSEGGKIKELRRIPVPVGELQKLQKLFGLITDARNYLIMQLDILEPNKLLSVLSPSALLDKNILRRFGILDYRPFNDDYLEHQLKSYRVYGLLNKGISEGDNKSGIDSEIKKIRDTEIERSIIEQYRKLLKKRFETFEYYETKSICEIIILEQKAINPDFTFELSIEDYRNIKRRIEEIDKTLVEYEEDELYLQELDSYIKKEEEAAAEAEAETQKKELMRIKIIIYILERRKSDELIKFMINTGVDDPLILKEIYKIIRLNKIGKATTAKKVINRLVYLKYFINNFDFIDDMLLEYLLILSLNKNPDKSEEVVIKELINDIYRKIKKIISYEYADEYADVYFNVEDIISGDIYKDFDIYLVNKDRELVKERIIAASQQGSLLTLEEYDSPDGGWYEQLEELYYILLEQHETQKDLKPKINLKQNEIKEKMKIKLGQDLGNERFNGAMNDFITKIEFFIRTSIEITNIFGKDYADYILFTGVEAAPAAETERIAREEAKAAAEVEAEIIARKEAEAQAKAEAEAENNKLTEETFNALLAFLETEEGKEKATSGKNPEIIKKYMRKKYSEWSRSSSEYKNKNELGEFMKKKWKARIEPPKLQTGKGLKKKSVKLKRHNNKTYKKRRQKKLNKSKRVSRN